MKKRTHTTLQPAKETITIKKFLLEDRQLLVLLLLTICITFFIICCIFSMDFFRAEYFYNYL